MEENIYSFVYDAKAAEKEFAKIGMHRLVLAMLSGVRPEADFDGCLVYEGMSPQDVENTVCIGTRGPGAGRVQEKLIEAFENKSVPVLQVFEGGPEVRQAIAKAAGGEWKEPA
ncbi:MAG TPA: hypothetical protein VM425_10635 [Myxococcota bacterium]|nr:hypothetical protein [Myxococcota bacterium]